MVRKGTAETVRNRAQKVWKRAKKWSTALRRTSYSEMQKHHWCSWSTQSLQTSNFLQESHLLTHIRVKERWKGLHRNLFDQLRTTRLQWSEHLKVEPHRLPPESNGRKQTKTGGKMRKRSGYFVGDRFFWPFSSGHIAVAIEAFPNTEGIKVIQK